MPALSIDDFTLEKAVIELRYAPALLLWDRAGRLWSRVLEKYPELKLLQAQPNQTVFNLGRDFQFSVQTEKANLITDEPEPGLEKFQELADSFVDTVVTTLEIAAVSRVGFRLTYFKTTRDQAEAVEVFRSTGRLRIPNGKLFGVENQHAGGAFTLRLEDKQLGATVRIEVEGRKVDFEPPFGLKEVASVTDLRHGVTFDIDLFTTSATPVSQLRASEWIKQGLHVIRRDSSPFLVQ